MARQTRVGVSGWSYKGWRDTFYPRGLPRGRELEFASRCFNSIEINGSFYSLQSPRSYESWFDEAPPGFVYSVKGSRFITHMKKLNQIEVPLARFFDSGIFHLREKLGPILWQFPPNLGFKPERFEHFLEILPRHDLEGRPLRHAFEVRHESFRCAEFFALLRESGAALVQADTAGRFPYIDELTADFVYVRLHGSKELYKSGYFDDELDLWAHRITRWQAGGRDAYVYFDNDAKVHAPFNAMALAEKLGLGEVDGATRDIRKLAG